MLVVNRGQLGVDLFDQSIELLVRLGHVGGVGGRILRITFRQRFSDRADKGLRVYRVKPEVGVKATLMVVGMFFMLLAFVIIVVMSMFFMLLALMIIVVVGVLFVLLALVIIVVMGMLFMFLTLMIILIVSMFFVLFSRMIVVTIGVLFMLLTFVIIMRMRFKRTAFAEGQLNDTVAVEQFHSPRA